MSEVLSWSVSSYSGGANNSCVAVAKVAGGVLVRNSNRPEESPIHFTDDEWQKFILGAKDGEFDFTRKPACA
jgi:hypothetical protein